MLNFTMTLNELTSTNESRCHHGERGGMRGKSSRVIAVSRRSNYRCGVLLLMVILATLQPYSVSASRGRWNKFDDLFRNPTKSRRGGEDSLGENNDELFVGPAEEELERNIRLLEKRQLQGQVEDLGMDVLADEVKDKKRFEIVQRVARGCAIGSQITLIMGGAALLFRLIPIWLGHDPDYEEHEGDAPLLVDAGTERSRALLAAERQGLLTEAGEDVEGDQRATDEGDEDREGLEGGSGALRSLGNENRALIEVDEVMAGKVVGFPEWRATLAKSKRASKPLLKAMAVALALIGLARLVLGDILATTIDPMDELLFGDDLMELYSTKMPAPPGEELPFPHDLDFIPGRTKMKSKTVQRQPRSVEEEDGGPDDRRNQEKSSGLLDVELDEYALSNS